MYERKENFLLPNTPAGWGWGETHVILQTNRRESMHLYAETASIIKPILTFNNLLIPAQTPVTLRDNRHTNLHQTAWKQIFLRRYKSQH